MRPSVLPILAILAALGSAPRTGMAEGTGPAGCARDAMLVFDGSGSMSGIGFNTGEATHMHRPAWRGPG